MNNIDRYFGEMLWILLLGYLAVPYAYADFWDPSLREWLWPTGMG
jgi:hypothetical protein